MIKIENVSKYFGAKCAVNNVSLPIERGDLLALLGPNGAGKSTLLAMIVGLVSPSKGRVVLENSNLASFGVVFENPSFYDYLSGRDNLVLLSRLKGCCNKENIDNLLDMVSLTNRAHDAVRKYSLGMRQRLALASALVSDPEILILDEPTNGLDPEGIQDILSLLSNFSKNHHKTIVISSHQVHDVETICNKVAIINDGSLLCAGKLSDLLEQDIQDCIVKTDSPAECIESLRGNRWIKEVCLMPRSKSLKNFYLESIRKWRENEKSYN